MLSIFGTLHAIATQRGDGLRHELINLLKRPRASTEIEAKSSFALSPTERVQEEAPTNTLKTAAVQAD